MAEPALQYDEFEDIEPIEIPAGGIATFLTAKESMFADDDNIPQGGIAQVKAVADQLAEFGRHEDEYMVHAAHGETVIPMEVFRKNPILKENIYKQMRDMGLEPERYVVGSEFNSINPVTGQPEFFLKKLFKGIKKVFKVVAPVVLQAVLTPVVGPIAAGAITGGITSLAQGGSFKDALKAAAIGGAIGGVTKAVQGAAGAAKTGGNVLTGAKEGFLAPRGTDPFLAGMTGKEVDFAALGADEVTRKQIEKQAAEILTEPVTTGGAPNLVETTGMGLAGASQGPYMPSNVSTAQQNLIRVGPNEPFDPVTNPGGRIGGPNVSTTTPSVTGAGAKTVADAAATSVEVPSLRSGLARLTGYGDAAFEPIEGFKDIFLPGLQQNAAVADAAAEFTKQTGFGRGTPEFAKFMANLDIKKLGFFRKFGPGIAGLLAVDALTREEPKDFNVAEAVENPLVGDRRYSPGTFLPRPTYTIKTLKPEDFVLPTTAPVYKPVPGVAEGGGIDENIFPRMMGPIEGPGTETSDDIPAMLSDGEFVMTAKAVRGAGNGSRQRGMRNMYNMMSNFEAMA